MYSLRKLYILYKYEQFLKLMCLSRSKTWTGPSPALACSYVMRGISSRVVRPFCLKLSGLKGSGDTKYGIVSYVLFRLVYFVSRRPYVCQHKRMRTRTWPTRPSVSLVKIYIEVHIVLSFGAFRCLLALLPLGN